MSSRLSAILPPRLSPTLVETVLTHLGFNCRPEPSPDSLRMIYGAWCRRVPFDNVQKLIHVRAGTTGPLPGSTATDFFESWLRHGTGGTCWAGSGALQALLAALGFCTSRGIGTMLVHPDLPPNHGTLEVAFGVDRLLVDTSIMTMEPLRLKDGMETFSIDPARGVRLTMRDDRWHIQWRPLHQPGGFECRLERFGASDADFRRHYEQTRPWSPFNYEINIRVNRGAETSGLAFGHHVTLLSDGSISRKPASHEDRVRFLCETAGLSEEIVSQLPVDMATPPPPWSAKAAA